MMSENIYDEMITRHNLEDNIISGIEGKIDFYAYCNTPWHSIGIQAFVNLMAKSNSEVRGIIFIANQPGKGHIVSENDFQFDKNVKVKFYKNIDALRENKKELLKKLVCGRTKIRDGYVNENFLILRPFRADIKFGAQYELLTGKKCKLYVIDEGVGTYKSNWEIFHEKQKGNKKEGILYILLSIFDLYLKRKYRLSVSYFTLFNYNKGRLRLNTSIAKLYQTELKKRVTEKEYIKPNGKYVIIATQPFEIEQDIRCRDKINDTYLNIMKVFEQKGISVYIKPHPRERDDVLKEYIKMGYKLIDMSDALEVYLEKLKIKPCMVIGAVSTALITVSVLNKVPSASIIDILGNKIDKDYLKTAQKFKKRYSDYIYFPKNLIEIANMVDKE